MFVQEEKMMWAKAHICIDTFPYLDQQILEISYRDLHYFHMHTLSLAVYLGMIMSFRVCACQSFMSLGPSGFYVAYIP